MANDMNRRQVQGTGTARTPQARPAGKRFKKPAQAAPTARSQRPQTAASSQRSAHRGGARTATPARAVRPAASRSTGGYTSYTSVHKGPAPWTVIVAILAAIAFVTVMAFVVVPRVTDLFMAEQTPSVEAGIEVQLNIPEGSSGDQIAQILSENHVIENPKEYYAAVRQLGADTSIKPGDYLFTTGQDPIDVVQQLVDGPNVEGIRLTIQEGLTVNQTAARVEEVFGISADDFLAQAKASNYVADYPFLEGAYNDSLEGYLYPKTYSFTQTPTADEIIRALLDQFVKETQGLSLEDGAHGLTEQEIISMASLIERESAVADERPQIASVIYNRLDAQMPLQIDAAIVYARGGGSQTVTYDDLEIDSPYNVYKNTGLTPGPICSPSISSIEAALHPADTDYLYYVLSSANDGTHKFSETYDEFLQNRQEYVDSRS